MNSKRNKPEILSPAGDLPHLKTAVAYGADAVYIGADAFGMRASAARFTQEKMEEGVAFAHEHGAKVYLTLNILPRNDDLAELPRVMAQATQAGIDAVIVTDIGVLAVVKELAPGMAVHISTQAGIVNHAAAKVFFQLGAERIVLARELSFEEIKEISAKIPPELEIEAFVHGAMCMAFSGRCVLSNYLAGRDANKGECAQPCRWKYHLVEEKRPGLFLPIEENEEGSFLLNAKDLCMLAYIPQLVEAGITSFKIEGRAKNEYYVATVTAAYRAALDLYWADPENYQLPTWILEEVEKVSHRPYSTGFYFGRPENGQSPEMSGYLRTYDVIALVERWENGRVYCVQRNKLSEGESVDVLIPGGRPLTQTVKEMQNENGQPITTAPHATMRFSMAMAERVSPGDILRKQVTPISVD